MASSPPIYAAHNRLEVETFLVNNDKEITVNEFWELLH